MATERKADPREAMWAAGRKATADMLRGADTGINHLAQKERWGNERKAAAFGKLVQAARAVTTQRKDGSRRALDEAGPALAHVAAAVYEKDKALADKAKAKANRPAAPPTSAEIAEQAQSDDPPVNPAALAAAQKLASQHQAAA